MFLQVRDDDGLITYKANQVVQQAPIVFFAFRYVPFVKTKPLNRVVRTLVFPSANRCSELDLTIYSVCQQSAIGLNTWIKQPGDFSGNWARGGVATAGLVLERKFVGLAVQCCKFVFLWPIAPLARKAEVRPLIRQPEVTVMPDQLDAIHRNAELRSEMVYIKNRTVTLRLAVPTLMSTGVR